MLGGNGYLICGCHINGQVAGQINLAVGHGIDTTGACGSCYRDIITGHDTAAQRPQSQTQASVAVNRNIGVCQVDFSTGKLSRRTVRTTGENSITVIRRTGKVDGRT